MDERLREPTGADRALLGAHRLNTMAPKFPVDAELLDRFARGAQDPNMGSDVEWVAERAGFRVGVERRADGLFQVHLERWIPGAVPDEPSYWSPVRFRTVLSDSASSARTLAAEELNVAVPPEV